MLIKLREIVQRLEEREENRNKRLKPLKKIERQPSRVSVGLGDTAVNEESVFGNEFKKAA